MRIGLLTLIAAGCSFRASYDGTHYKCGEGDVCPSGQTCVAGECVAGTFDAPPGSPDSSTTDAPPGTPDAPMTQGRCGTLALLRDDFTGTAVGPLWDPWTDGGPTVSESNGRFVIALPGGSQGSNGPWAGAGTRFEYDFTGSVLQSTISQIGGTDTVLEVRGHDGGKVQMVVEQGVLYAGVYDLPGQGTRAQVTYDPSVHKRWRLREANGVTYWEWSTDGNAWTELWHENDPFPPDHVRAELAAGGQKSSATEAHFEYVNTDVTPPAPFCGASSLTDDFTAGSFDKRWSAWADTPATIAQTGGNVVITTDGTTNIWSGFQSNHLYDLTDQAFYIDAATIPQKSPYVAWMQAMEPDDDHLEINVEGNTLQVLQVVGGSKVTNQSVTYDPVAQRYWRMRADATNIYMDTSPDGTTWTNRATAAAQIDPRALMLIVGGGEYAATTAQTQRIGGVNVH
ncbi:MAG TPA: hypothetical protein VL463_10150 [Kofleriaceae bacterium]|nr:hypothetical protein [Kofleriaceae bacterium]